MRCPYCGHLETKVIDSRDAEDVEVTRRRRECEKCEKRFTSYERVEMVDLYVKKKDGNYVIIPEKNVVLIPTTHAEDTVKKQGTA